MLVSAIHCHNFLLYEIHFAVHIAVLWTHNSHSMACTADTFHYHIYISGFPVMFMKKRRDIMDVTIFAFIICINGWRKKQRHQQAHRHQKSNINRWLAHAPRCETVKKCGPLLVCLSAMLYLHFSSSVHVSLPLASHPVCLVRITDNYSRN